MRDEAQKQVKSEPRRTGIWRFVFGVLITVSLVTGVSFGAVQKESSAVLSMIAGAVSESKAQTRPDGNTQRDSEKPTATDPGNSSGRISALGRLEPQGEIVRLCAPEFLKAERVARVCVSNGQSVRKGDLIAVMDSRTRLEAAFAESQKRVATCQAQLNRVMAGAKHSEIMAQEAAVERWQAELAGRLCQMKSEGERLKSEAELAQLDFGRYQKLFAEGAVSEAELDLRRSKMQTSLARLQEAQAEARRVETTIKSAILEASETKKKIAEVRPEDVAVARAELESAQASAAKIKTDMELCNIRSPLNGHLLKLWAHAGESPRESGIAELGSTEQMMAVAEIFESDVKYIHKGQKAVISSSAINGELTGVVSEFAWKVSKQNIYSNEPGDNFDNRVVEVKIKLSPESSKRVQALSNLQIEIEILV